MSEYICHFCENTKCKAIGWFEEIPTTWRCQSCDTEYYKLVPGHFFGPHHWMAFQVYTDKVYNEEGYHIIVDFLENNTKIYYIEDMSKLIIVPFIADVTPTNKEQWLARMLKLKAFL